MLDIAREIRVFALLESASTLIGVRDLVVISFFKLVDSLRSIDLFVAIVKLIE